ncbi:MAG: SUMF1/EgtB/PvdO family nonheme iron enzyme [Alphaproteobacteria bacterium]
MLAGGRPTTPCGPEIPIKDCDDCPEMAVIPSAHFRMGDLQGGGHDGEKPVHDVRIDYSFPVDKVEVTQA